MADVAITASADDLWCLIGILSMGHDPTQHLAPARSAEYVALGRQFAEILALRRRHDELEATLAATQQQMASGIQVAMPGDEPTAVATDAAGD